MPASSAISLEKAEKNRSAFRALLQKAQVSQTQVAALLSQETGRHCGLRTIVAWLAHPDKPSSRRCPDWAVIEFKRALLRLNLIKPE